MSSHRVVVDGSNIATEGRSLPSLVQLDEAVRAYREEHPDVEVIVVVDATFAHRIAESERAMFEEAAAHNELVYPPAGAIGRGDAFLLRIADKTDAVVLSNDSFQEFHGEFEWLFTKGRLIGGTPVPGVGWIFVPRTPVRGPKSREAVKEAKRGKARIGSKDALAPMPVPKAPPPRSPKNKDAKGGDTSRPSKSGQPKQGRIKAVIDEAIEEAVDPGLVAAHDADDADEKGGRKRRRKRKGAAPTLPTVNEPLTFIQFIADHQPGATVEGEIESFASHGAFVLVGDARCYIPLSAMGNPPPRSAREALNRGETRTFVVQALDAPRRGIELALPGFEKLAGRPTDETVEAEIGEAPPPIAAKPARRSRKVAPVAATPAAAPAAPPKKAATAKKTAITKKAATPAKKATAPKKAAIPVPAVEAPAPVRAKKASARKVAGAQKTAPVAPKKPTVAKTPAAAKKATPKAATPAKKAPAKKAAAPVKKTAPATAPKKAAPAKKVAGAKKAPAAKAAPAPAKKAPVKKAPAKRAAKKSASS